MKKLWTLSLVALIFSSCITSRNNNSKSDVVDPYLPEILEGLKFGMTLEEVTALRKDMAPINYVRDEFSFRKEYIENLDDPAIERVIYYFDADGNKPFYEAIITYKTTEALNTDANLLFDKPNYQGKEWKYSTKNKIEIQAWKFDKKLVVVGLLPGTEWSEESME